MIRVNGQVVWFTGLSGAGKSTICEGVSERLRAMGLSVEILDGDAVRKSLCRGLTFTEDDRLENVRRISFVANLLSKHGVIVLVAAITPLNSMREIPKALCQTFVEVFVDASIEVCEARDPKGLYRRARAGQIREFTGIDSPFERPQSPDVVCCTRSETVTTSINQVMDFLCGASPAVSNKEVGEKSAESMQHLRRDTIAVDFDGVIAEYDGWRGIDKLGEPRQDVRQALQQLRGEGWKIVIYTTRSADHILSYLRGHDVPFDEIDLNSDYLTGSCKPVATVYWDDRAVTYSGNASNDLRHIRVFRTWSGRR